MDNHKEHNSKQIDDIVSVVKLSSLLFLGMGFFEYTVNNNKSMNAANSLFPLQVIITGVLVFTFVYCLWTFSTVKKIHFKNVRRLQLFENLVIVLIFLFVLLMSGANASDFKFLFLLIIITTTIQSGSKHGMLVACISSFAILAMDMLYSSNSSVNRYFQNDIIMAGVFVLTAWPLGFYVENANKHIKQLESLANEDGLTGVFNHRYFHEALNKTISYAENANTPVSLMFLDIDYFKHYNDLYGHQRGDEALRIIGSLLKKIARSGDIVARYGGEEFSIILPNTSEDDASSLAETIRKKVEETYFEGEENQPKGKLTVSIGISVYPYKAKNDIDLLKSADDALYRAKFFRKNRVETYSSILDELKKDIDEEHIDLITSIKTLISVINAKDRYTYTHVERVVAYCRLFATKLNLSDEENKILIYGAYMHDIGKINISKDILIKKMPLTLDEWETLKQHPANGVEIISPVNSLNNIIPLILHHHERYDGSGYPLGLRGKEIPYLSRVLTVIDSFDAMTSNRPYNKRKTHQEAIDELKKYSGSQFDSDIVNLFIEIIEENSFLE